MTLKPSIQTDGEVNPELQQRRKLNPEKLRAARLRAGYTNISDVSRRIKIKRLAYSRWEQSPGLTHFDYVAFANALALFGVAFEDVTDSLDEETAEPEHLPALPSPARQLVSA